MRKIILVLIGLSLLSLTACSGKKVAITADDAKANEIIITADKKAQTVIKESFEKKYYKEKELKKFIKEDIKKFNSANKTKVELNSMKVKDDYVYVVLDYSSVDDLNKYNVGTEVTKLSVSKAKKSDLIPDKLTKYGKKTKVSKSEALKKSKYKVVVLAAVDEVIETVATENVEDTQSPQETQNPEETQIPEGEAEQTATPEPTVEPTEVPKTTKVNIQLTVAGKIKYVANATKKDKNTAKVTSLDEPVVIVYK